MLAYKFTSFENIFKILLRHGPAELFSLAAQQPFAYFAQHSVPILLFGQEGLAVFLFFFFMACRVTFITEQIYA